MKTPQAFRGKKVRQMAQGRSRVAILLALLVACPVSFLAAPASAGELSCGTLIAKGCEAWVALFSDGEVDRPFVEAAPDGSKVFVVAGNLIPGEYRTIVNAYDPETGALLWNTSYMPRNGPGVTAITVSPDNSRLYVVGTVGQNSLPAAFLLSYDTQDGSLTWEHHWIPGTYPRDIATSPDGSRVFVAGWKYHDYLVSALDARTGQSTWEATYDHQGGRAADVLFPSYDVAYDLETSPDGSVVFVTGLSADVDGQLGYATLAYDAVSGTLRWVARHHAADLLGPTHTGGYDLAVSPDGRRVYVLGSDGALAYDAVTGADVWGHQTLGASCRQFWSQSIEGECDLTISPDGSRLVAGTHNAIAAYAPSDGRLLWRTPLAVGDEDEKTSNYLGNGIELSPDGSRVYAISSGGRDPWVTSSVTSINGNYETYALDATDGRLLWRAVYDRAVEEVGSVALSPEGGRIFVAGASTVRLPTELALVAYDTDLGLENTPTLSI
jgi:outer membrane protein assembly factor BamB